MNIIGQAWTSATELRLRFRRRFCAPGAGFVELDLTTLAAGLSEIELVVAFNETINRTDLDSFAL